MSEEDIKKYTEKTDKHIDELEEDIQFLNEGFPHIILFFISY